MKTVLRYLFLSVIVAVFCSGCQPLASALYVMSGEGDIKAQYAGLKEKRVVVVCRSVSALQYQNSGAAKEIAKQVGIRLKSHIKKVDLVPRNDIDHWMDENNNDDFVAIGKGLKADLVVGIDLESFSLYQGANVYRGNAVTNVTVYDIKDRGEIAWDRKLPKILFPPNSDVPASEKPEAEFRQKFVEKIAETIAHQFYDHPLAEDFAVEGDY